MTKRKTEKTPADGRAAVEAFLSAHRVLLAAVTGPDKKPAVQPLEQCFEDGGLPYFALAKCEAFYGALSLAPDLVLCALEESTGTVLTLRGTAVFTEEPEIIARCLEGSSRLREKWGGEPGMLIAFFLKNAAAALVSLNGGEEITADLGTPDGALLGITIKKKTELRDRLSRILERREAEGAAPQNEAEEHRQKLYDGALLYFAETAKALWPRMDIRPIERSALFETYDERERFTGLSAKLIGNAVIAKPEDLTYWLNKETLDGLERKR